MPGIRKTVETRRSDMHAFDCRRASEHAGLLELLNERWSTAASRRNAADESANILYADP
jgi:hypothetical protein